MKNKTVTVTVPEDHVVLTMPEVAWGTIQETLEMDAESSAFDAALREEIGDAVEAITIHR